MRYEISTTIAVTKDTMLFARPENRTATNMMNAIPTIVQTHMMRFLPKV